MTKKPKRPARGRPAPKAKSKQPAEPKITLSQKHLDQIVAALQKKITPVEVAKQEINLFDLNPDEGRSDKPDFRDAGLAFSRDANGEPTINTVNDIPFTKDNWLAMNHVLNTKIEALANRISSIQKMQFNSANTGVRR